MRNWKYTINIEPYLSDSEDSETLLKESNGIATEIKKLIDLKPTWLDEYDLNQLIDMVDYLTGCDDLDEINYQLDELYDFGDTHSIWINTIG